MFDLTCRFCSAPLKETFVDLGQSPLSNAYLDQSALMSMEPFFPLHSYVCSSCRLVQLPEYEKPEKIFSDYSYFSSYSDSWLDHCRRYVDMITERHHLTNKSQVVELASNDGYLLQYFKKKSIPCLGVEPAANVAIVAEQKGIPTRVMYFGSQSAKTLLAEGLGADLIIANNVLAHVPNLNDFVQGIRILLKSTGIATLEMPHLKNLIEQNQFDTIYHEHYSYFSLIVLDNVFRKHGLRLFDVEQLPTHGGSLRIFVCHDGNAAIATTSSVDKLIQQEKAAGYLDSDVYARFNEQVKLTKRRLLRFLLEACDQGKSVAGYGAPAKGNTLLNFCGIRADLLPYTVDLSPHKAGRYLPGSHIPVYFPDQLQKTKPDYVLILPWNLKDEVVAQQAIVRSWGGKFVVPIPEVSILP